ncbi:MAG TPA: TetR/AcrR family transcriptional regulator [Desulfosalsimonadaceae bacterium]|nr:TetR/AcrR family transcriptional regulator [Desulfosalsimonadaceae bacterium]
MQTAPDPMHSFRFDEFRQMALVSMEEICRETFRENQASIKTKKETVAVRNLTNIFNTTLQLSNEKGFHTMSLRDLSQASGLSMGALYSYFTSKEELLEMIQNQGRRLTQRVLRQQIEPVEAVDKKLQTAIRTHLYLTEVMHPWFYFSFMETKNLDKTQQKKSIEGELASEQIYSEILQEGLEKAVFSVEKPVLTATVIKAMMQDWYLKRWKYSRRSISVDEYADFVISVVESIVMPNPRRSC